MEYDNNNYTFTIIIPTYNRKDYLIATLGFIKQQTVLPLEIIVVDASEQVFQLTELDQQPFKPLLKYITWSEYGNISKQRNHAIGMAKGNYILFLDDDVIFKEDLIANYVEAFITTNADGISGVVETAKYRFGSAPFKLKGILADIGEFNLQPCDIIAKTKIICTASFAVKTSVLKIIEGFDEFQRGVYDDIEVGFRLSNEGYLILHHSLPRIFHIQAQASGARHSSHGNSWAVENQVYFQLKHRYNKKKRLFFFLMMFDSIRPSRIWLHPGKLLARIKVRINSYRRFCTF